jgi:hypothetical protein
MSESESRQRAYARILSVLAAAGITTVIAPPGTEAQGSGGACGYYCYSDGHGYTFCHYSGYPGAVCEVVGNDCILYPCC